MQVGANQGYLLGLFNSSSSSSGNGIINIDLSSLAVDTASTSANGTSSGSTATGPTGPTPPTPPWNAAETTLQASSNVQNALAGLPIISQGNSVGPSPGISASDAEDYSKLFSLYQGLSTLNDIATQANSKSLSPQQQTQLANAFNSGLSQVSSFVSTTDLANLRLAFGGDATSATAKLTTSQAPSFYTYTTPPLATTDVGDLPQFDGNVQFNIAVKLNSKTTNVPIDLSGMGTQTRSLGNVVTYINQQLKAAGVETKVAVDRIPGTAQTITVGGSTVTLPQTADQYALQVNVGTSETVTFSAPQTAGAVYVAQTSGNPNPDNNPLTNDSTTRDQLSKFQTDTTNVSAPPQTAGQPNYTQGRVFSENLDTNIGTVHDETVGPDGSVYMLADVTGTTEGQTIQGTQDVALLKYDSAGHLLYTRTLGASDTASGLSLAVSSTGQVAVAGSVTGALNGAVNGALNSAPSSGDTDSFVTLYDSSGNEVWTERRGSTGNDQANQVAFSADGKTVYVAGQATGTMPGAAAIGNQDGYIEGFQTSATGTPHAVFTQSFGTTGQDSAKGMVVDGSSLITASVENGDAVLRNYDISSGTPVLTTSRDLGSLNGGTIAGLSLNGSQVVVAGTTSNGSLSAGTVTSAATGGTQAFAAQVDASLTPSSSDAISYFGGVGTQATSLAVANGQIWVGGSTTSALPGQTFTGTKDGFIAQLNISTGQIVNSNQFTGADGMDTPTAIAVDTSGSSILDRLGLPTSPLLPATSQSVVSDSSLRPGDQFTVAAGSAPPVTITITAADTLTTLAQEIQRASGNEATATVTHTATGAQTLTIKPAYAQATVTLGAGPAGKDALSTLGLPQGMLNQTVTSNNVTSPADGGSAIFGLGLSSTMSLDSPAQITQATASIGAAMGVVRQAYQSIVTAEQPKLPGGQSAAVAAAAANSGTVPAYLTAQLANLQAGLARLTGGNPAPSTSTFA
ncbi:MAG TPA: hypothetical protein VFE18_01685 [Phenylobacterium sp.]|jgi:hypothetical protein|uniref:beta strand repeat-containing protein n=1 Tax=Phenylobacterium sp. TaxID=1871053 RepID=UPI002D4EA589|nr:hypothetical protein [Phenylobacterium sp.]HZZ66860.1 hypothetical protein [Phenylobacterium sp.]